MFFLLHSFFQSVSLIIFLDVIVEKEPVVIPHIENILNFNGVCDEQPHILTILPSPSKQQQPDAKDERRLKRHRSERRREGDDDDESDDEDLRKKIARLNHHNQLEREYRDLQEQLNSERLKLMERRLDTLTKSVQESNQENQYLRRALNQQQRANNNNGFLQQQKAEPPKRRRVAQPKARKMHQQAPIHAQEPQQQQSLDQFMLVPYQGPQQQEQMTVEQQVIPMPVIDITETAEFIAQQNEFIARCEAEETQAINLLMPFTEQGVTNIGVQFMHRYKLSGYLELLLQAMRDPTRNHHINEILEHPFMKNYKITLVPNISLAAQPFTSQIESNRQMLLQSNQALNKQSLEVRRNISMVNVHCWFLSKAIRYEDMADAGQLAYKPMLMSQFPHFYDAEICRAWYPYVDSGNNCIITPDLKIPARSIQHGQGHGKHCCFCDFQYIANSEGRLKFAHQVKNCDFIAEMSYDERVILSVVLEKRHSSAEFNKHPFIAKYNPQSLLRRATAEEISQGKFLPFKGDKLRINMATLLSMRQRAYGRFLARVESLDIHDANTEDKLKNLDAKPIAHQLDCFYLTSTPPQPNNVAAADGNKKAASRAKKQTKPGSVQSDRIKKTDGFLYKTLLDYDGNQFRKSKFDEADKTLRDFTLNESTGFGDGMYFSCMYDPLPDRYPTANALPFTVPPIAQQVNDYLASQQQQQFFLPPPQLMLEQYEQQQQQATEVEEQGMEIVFNNEIPSPIAMPTPSPIIIDIATSTTTTTTFMHDHFGARTNEDYGEEDNNDIWGNAKQKEPSIFGSFEIEDSGVIDINAMFTRRDQVFGDPYSFDSDNSSFSKNKTFSSFGDYF